MELSEKRTVVAKHPKGIRAAWNFGQAVPFVPLSFEQGEKLTVRIGRIVKIVHVN